MYHWTCRKKYFEKVIYNNNNNNNNFIFYIALHYEYPWRFPVIVNRVSTVIQPNVTCHKSGICILTVPKSLTIKVGFQFGFKCL